MSELERLTDVPPALPDNVVGVDPMKFLESWSAFEEGTQDEARKWFDRFFSGSDEKDPDVRILHDHPPCVEHGEQVALAELTRQEEPKVFAEAKTLNDLHQVVVEGWGVVLCPRMRVHDLGDEVPKRSFPEFAFLFENRGL